jgi:hypothetical protein
MVHWLEVLEIARTITYSDDNNQLIWQHETNGFYERRFFEHYLSYPSYLHHISAGQWLRFFCLYLRQLVYDSPSGQRCTN